MRRYVMANARKRGQRKFEDMYFDDEMFEEIYYNEHGEPINVRNTTNREQQSDAGRAAQLVRKLSFFNENSIENRSKSEIFSSKCCFLTKNAFQAPYFPILAGKRVK